MKKEHVLVGLICFCFFTVFIAFGALVFSALKQCGADDQCYKGIINKVAFMLSMATNAGIVGLAYHAFLSEVTAPSEPLRFPGELKREKKAE